MEPISNTISNTISNIYLYLEDILIIREYEISPEDDLINKTEMFILRYRRILGIVLLIILLYIMFSCDNTKTIVFQNGGASVKGFGKILSKQGSKIKSKLSQTDTKKQIGKMADSLKGSVEESDLGKKVAGMKEAGFSNFDIAKRGVYGAGASVGNTFKEFSGWLYEILFAIAISIAICMVILPSLSFFIVGLICYFLLKSKISALKSA